MRIHSPVTGELLDIRQVPDEVFASQMLGSGLAVAVQAAQVDVVSPVAGTVVKVMPHAVVVSDGDLAILVHIGVDTVSRQEFFDPLVAQGDQVTVGQTVTRCDLSEIIAQDGVCPVIMTVLDSPADAIEVLAPAGSVVEARQLIAQLP